MSVTTQLGLTIFGFMVGSTAYLVATSPSYGWKNSSIRIYFLYNFSNLLNLTAPQTTHAAHNASNLEENIQSAWLSVSSAVNQSFSRAGGGKNV